MKQDTLAAIDIGSNAIRLLINYVEISGGSYELKKAAYLRLPIRLGEDVFSSGRVSEARANRLLEAMQGFQHLMRAYGVSDLRACATSAMRDAQNGAELVAAVREDAGIDIEIISGDEEADLIHTAGAQRGNDSGTLLYIDVGGGSTELVLYKNNQLRFHGSFQLGTVRTLVSEAGGALGLGGSLDQDAEKARFADTLKELHARYAPACAIASGGNINKLHKTLGKKSDEPVTPGELKDFLNKLKPLSLEERMHTFGFNDYRADVIVPALEIFLRISRECPSIRNFYVPKIGLADGLIHDLCKRRLAAG